MMQFDHYIIRLLATSDLAPYFELVQRNRPRLEAFFAGTASRTKTFADTQDFVAEMTQRAQTRTYFPYLIVDQMTSQPVGFLDLKNIDWNLPKSELGFYVDAAYAGRGVMTRALQHFCDFCFAAHGFQKLFLRTHPDNTAARRVAEKCGFQVEGLIRRDYKTTAGDLVDLLYYGKLR